jgi:hypothetical protein
MQSNLSFFVKHILYVCSQNFDEILFVRSKNLAENVFVCMYIFKSLTKNINFDYKYSYVSRRNDHNSDFKTNR